MCVGTFLNLNLALETCFIRFRNEVFPYTVRHGAWGIGHRVLSFVFSIV